MTIEIGEDRHGEELQRRFAPSFHRGGQRFPVGMNSQKFDAHGGDSLGGSTNGFLDIEKLQIEKDPLPSLDEPLNHIRSRGGVELETDLHERDLILNAIHESFGFGGG